MTCEREMRGKAEGICEQRDKEENCGYVSRKRGRKLPGYVSGEMRKKAGDI